MLDLANSKGEVFIRYGMNAMEPGSEKTRLVFDNAGKVTEPRSGMKFDL